MSSSVKAEFEMSKSMQSAATIVASLDSCASAHATSDAAENVDDGLADLPVLDLLTSMPDLGPDNTAFEVRAGMGVACPKMLFVVKETSCVMTITECLAACAGFLWWRQ